MCHIYPVLHIFIYIYIIFFNRPKIIKRKWNLKESPHRGHTAGDLTYFSRIYFIHRVHFHFLSIIYYVILLISVICISLKSILLAASFDLLGFMTATGPDGRITCFPSSPASTPSRSQPPPPTVRSLRPDGQRPRCGGVRAVASYVPWSRMLTQLVR